MTWTTDESLVKEPVRLKKELTADMFLPSLSTNPKMVSALNTDGITVRIGGKLVKLQVTEEISLPEDEIRKELETIMVKKVDAIQKDFDQKVVEISYMSDMTRRELEQKEKSLNEKIKSMKPMPEISWEHAKAGLTVVRGANAGEYFWLYQTVYWPKYVDDRPISATYIKKMITPMTIVVSTKDEKVTGVICRKTIGLDKFDHYHNQTSNDCWGVWKWKPEWKTPADIITVCKEATAVLENINGNSLARRNPDGLPTYAAVRKNSVARGEAPAEQKLSKNDERMGITESNDRDEVTGGSWTT